MWTTKCHLECHLVWKHMHLLLHPDVKRDIIHHLCICSESYGSRSVYMFVTKYLSYNMTIIAQMTLTLSSADGHQNSRNLLKKGVLGMNMTALAMHETRNSLILQASKQLVCKSMLLPFSYLTRSHLWLLTEKGWEKGLLKTAKWLLCLYNVVDPLLSILYIHCAKGCTLVPFIIDRYHNL